MFTRGNATDTGLIVVSSGGPCPVYHCFLGIRTSDASGTIAVLADYAEPAERTVYRGLGYQLAVPVAAPPVVSIPPVSQAVLIGDDATVSVAASSIVPLEYQWQFNEGDIVGETNETLTVAAVQKADAGRYRVRITNSEGSVVTPDDVYLVALEDYVGTLIYPDATNTVLARDGSPTWSAISQAEAESGGEWWARTEFAVTRVPERPQTRPSGSENRRIHASTRSGQPMGPPRFVCHHRARPQAWWMSSAARLRGWSAMRRKLWLTCGRLKTNWSYGRLFSGIVRGSQQLPPRRRGATPGSDRAQAKNNGCRVVPLFFRRSERGLR